MFQNLPGRPYWYLTQQDLEELKTLALNEHDEFFKRNPHLKSPFCDSLIGICFSQDASMGYTSPDIGLKDFDIWHFYKEHQSINFPYRSHKTNEEDRKGKRIGFFKRAIPQRICNLSPDEPALVIADYLRTQGKTKLLEKGVVGLWPESIFGKIIKNEPGLLPIDNSL